MRSLLHALSISPCLFSLSLSPLSRVGNWKNYDIQAHYPAGPAEEFSFRSIYIIFPLLFLVPQILDRLAKEHPQLEAIAINSKVFSSESTNLLESHHNTIIYLLLTILQRLDALEELTAKVGLDNKTDKYKTEITLEQVEKDISQVTTKITDSIKTIEIKDILGPKVIIK